MKKGLDDLLKEFGDLTARVDETDTTVHKRVDGRSERRGC